MPHFEVELGRNRSLPDIKPFSSDDHRTPARGSSLTNPRTNPGPFRSRQKPQNQLPNQHHQIATAMSNEPITSMTTADMQGSLQDAYGGTTDDWRQAQQAEQEARERQKLKDSSPTDRSGHISINSVSTLNLPPSNATVTPPQTRSMSRILLPDRDRFHNNNNHAFNSGVQASASLQGHGQFVEEPTQENTSLAKATTQPGGILSQLQAATEKGQVIDPITSVWSQKEGKYIQRSNTAPYPLRENRTIAEEEEAESLAGSGQRGPLEYSKSEGYGAASRRDRQPRRVQPQQDQEQLVEGEEEQQQTHSQHNDLRNDPSHAPPHQADQEPLNISRSRAMSHENVVDTNKDLPPTPFRQPTPPGQVSSDASSRQHRQQQKGQRLRSDSQSETSRHQNYQQQHHHRPSARSGSGNGPITSEESVLTLSRSMSPPPHRRISHERNASFGNINLNLTRGASTAGQQQHHHHQANGGPNNGNVNKEHVQYGIDMLPLPVIPSPDESLKKNANLGILPQDVLKTLDPTTVQKVITVSVIASRVYKVLALEEVESLRKVKNLPKFWLDLLHVNVYVSFK